MELPAAASELLLSALRVMLAQPAALCALAKPATPFAHRIAKLQTGHASCDALQRSVAAALLDAVAAMGAARARVRLACVCCGARHIVDDAASWPAWHRRRDAARAGACRDSAAALQWMGLLLQGGPALARLCRAAAPPDDADNSTAHGWRQFAERVMPAWRELHRAVAGREGTRLARAASLIKSSAMATKHFGSDHGASVLLLLGATPQEVAAGDALSGA
jgi:hypothetical protein